AIRAMTDPYVRVVERTLRDDLVFVDHEVLWDPTRIEVDEITPAPVHRLDTIEVALRFRVQNVEREIHPIVGLELECRKRARRVAIADRVQAASEIRQD